MEAEVKNIELSDEALVSLIAEQRDRDALAVLYNRYTHSLGGFLARKLKDQKLIDDVYNEVMFTVWEKAENFLGGSKVSTWIFGIAFRVSMAHIRKESKHTKRIDEQELDELPQLQSSSSEHTDRLESLNRAMKHLSEEHRQVTELAYYMGNSIAEIAEIMDCPLNTVKTRLYHARMQLKRYVGLAASAA